MLNQTLTAFFVLFLTALLGLSAAAESVREEDAPALSMRAFAMLPVLHEERIKPLDSFARIHLRRFYGKESFGSTSPASWLAATIFKPEDAVTQKLFRLPSPALRERLELPASDATHYSYETLAPRMDALRGQYENIVNKEQDKRIPVEQALLTLYENLDDYAQLLRSFTMLQPVEIKLSDALIEKLGWQGMEETPRHYLAWMAYRPAMEDALREVLATKGGELADYTPVERELALLSFTLNKISLAGQNNKLLRILPDAANQPQNIALSPWEAALQAKDAKAAFPPTWGALMQAYRHKDVEGWERALNTLTQKAKSLENVNATLLKVEYYYQQSSPLTVAMYGYIVALGILLLGWLGVDRALPFSRVVYIGAVLVHLGALVARIAILQRPPVTSLYESVLFVAFIGGIYGLWLSYKYMPRHAILIGGIIAAGLLGVSDLYAEKGDTMVMPIAVLNTNFWLGTHVLTITIGYGCALIAGSMAHLALCNKDTSSIFYRILPVTLVLALLFTTVGTILGGIWADQSWGRFWGWDPKENGALLIVLWLSWILHGRMTNSMGAHGAAALTACTNIIVALSWFGVNLLNTGLHSYGFTENAALGLALFCGVEIVLIGLLYLRVRLQKAQPSA